MDYKAAVITVSDRCSTGEKVDKSGPAVAQMLEEAGFPVIYRGLVPDERHEISAEFIKCAYELGADLIVSTGGTGFGKRDITPRLRATLSRERYRPFPRRCCITVSALLRAQCSQGASPEYAAKASFSTSPATRAAQNRI